MRGYGTLLLPSVHHTTRSITSSSFPPAAARQRRLPHHIRHPPIHAAILNPLIKRGLFGRMTDWAAGLQYWYGTAVRALPPGTSVPYEHTGSTSISTSHPPHLPGSPARQQGDDSYETTVRVLMYSYLYEYGTASMLVLTYPYQVRNVIRVPTYQVHNVIRLVSSSGVLLLDCLTALLSCCLCLRADPYGCNVVTL